MKQHERRDKIARIRVASVAWQAADREIEAATGRRLRVRRFVHEMLHGGPQDIEINADVPRAMRRAWERATVATPGSGLKAARLAAVEEGKQAAQAAIYTPEFLESLEHLRLHEPSGMDEALVFLEANPICFHSGYDKQRIARYLRHVPLSAEQQEQLRAALLVAAREGAGVEFRDYCRTARIVDTPRFRDDLSTIRHHPAQSDGARQRAGWMLDAIIRTNGPAPTPARLPRAGPRSRSG